MKKVFSNVRDFRPARLTCQSGLDFASLDAIDTSTDYPDLSSFAPGGYNAPASLSTVSPNLSVSSQYNPGGTMDASDLMDSLNNAMNFGGTIASALTGGNTTGSPIYMTGPAVVTKPSAFSGSGLILLLGAGLILYLVLR
jgi:hypothetical protein